MERLMKKCKCCGYEQEVIVLDCIVNWFCVYCGNRI